MKFSIIIATLDRHYQLKLLLESFLNQSYNNFELIIIDQNESLIDKLIQDYSVKLPIKHIKTSIKGLSRARNIGLKVVSGDIISFADDDCEYLLNTLQSIAKGFNKKNVDFISVKILDKETLKDVGIKWPSKEQIINLENMFKTTMSASLFIKIDAIRNLYFDEDFGVGAKYGSAEESDYLVRLLDKGAKGIYLPNYYIFHPLHQNKICFKRDLFYSKGLGAFHRKHFAKFTFSKIISVTLVRPLGGALLNIYNIKFFSYLTIFIGRVIGFITYTK